MMSAQTDFAPAPKRTAMTYGKNKQRAVLSRAPEAREPSVKVPLTTSHHIASRPKTDSATTRRPGASLPRVREREREANSETESIWDVAVDKEKRNDPLPRIIKPLKSLSEASSKKQLATAESVAEGSRPAKRKLVQQPAARVVKKQRSSSPDVFAFPSSSPPRARSPRPAPATNARLAEPQKARKLGPTPTPRPSGSGSLKATKENDDKFQQRNLGRGLQQPSVALPKPLLSISAKERPGPQSSTSVRERPKPMLSTSMKERPKPLVSTSVKDWAKPLPSLSANVSPEVLPTKKPVSTREKSVFAVAQEPVSTRETPTVVLTKEAVSVTEKVARITTTETIPNRTKPTPSSAPVRRRPRLIDALNAQIEHTPPSSPSSASSADEDAMRALPGNQGSQTTGPPAIQVSSPAPATSETPRARTYARQSSMIRKPGLKYTYSQQRTMLADEALLEGMDPDKAEEIAFSQPLLGPSISNASAFDFDDGLVEDASTSGAVRSIHELRQAGANNRFADEMDDILDRIGTPSAKPSSRRNALLEMAQKVQEKAFRRQFSNHRNGTSVLLRGLGKETDPISGLLIAAILVTLLGTATSSHLARQLPLADIAQLSLLLVPLSADVEALAKERKSNLSGYAQTKMSGVKASLLQLDVWEPAKPSRLSPRALALKCLHLITQRAGHLSDIETVMPSGVTDALFDILASAAAAERRDSKWWDFPAQPESMDLLVTLSLLEGHSIMIMQSQAAVTLWNGKHLPTVASLLETTLKHRPEQLGELETLVLKLTLNTANNNPEAHDIYLSKGLVRDLAQAACLTFDSVLQSIADESFGHSVLNSLVLMLGVMINFSEHGHAAAQTLAGFPPLDKLIGFFLDYRSRTAEADSVEKSHLNVAFGYLSVLLGYLCQHEPIRLRFKSIYTGRSLSPLVSSIREFMVLHQAADSASEPDSDVSGFAQRMQSLVDSLQRLS